MHRPDIYFPTAEGVSVKKGKANSRWEFQMERENAKTSSLTLSTYYQHTDGLAIINIATPEGQVLHSPQTLCASGPAFALTAKYKYAAATAKRTTAE